MSRREAAGGRPQGAVGPRVLRCVARLAVVLAVAAALPGIAPLLGRRTALARPPGADGSRLADAERALEELRVEEAARDLEALAARHPRDPDVLARLALLRFHQGRYGEATRALERSIADEGAPDPQSAFLLELFRATRDETGDLETSRSRDGRYLVLHPPGSDEVLVPWAEDALRRAEAVLSEALGVRLPGPLRLEIYPSPRALAAVSTLTVDEIERTGTIALSKWDRLMVTSPKALPRGYPWLDTVAHELVHLMLARVTHDRAPVWLQEGVAKFLEGRWREAAPPGGGAPVIPRPEVADEPPDEAALPGPRFPYLDPASEGLLFEAVSGGGLIPFDDLHPSIARLPSQRDAALAFAQVATFVGTYLERHGPDALRRALPLIAEGVDAREALAREAGRSFPELEASWRAVLRQRRDAAGTASRPEVRPLRFGEAPSRADEATEVDVETARRHLRLGDMLWDRGRAGAATVEYGRAHEAAPLDPIVGSRLGHAALAADDPERAIDALEPLLARHPNHAPLYVLLGQARLARSARGEAEAAFVEAIRLNPFDPAPHCGLAEATDDPRLRDRARAGCRRLQRR